MSWPRIISTVCSTLALAGCAAHQPPGAQPPAQATDAQASPESMHQAAARARLRAVVRDQSFLEHLPEAVRASSLIEPLSGRMVIVYVVDDGGAARHAQESDLVESGVTREALRAVVEWNLAQVLVEPLSCTSHALSEPAHHNYYESSRLLLDKQWADLAGRAGTLVVAAPSNDTLFVACNPTPEVLRKLAVVVQNSYPQAPRPVSSSLLTWASDGWHELPPP
jgi:uncharacterized protein YtpQ (UPF0354 family)